MSLLTYQDASPWAEALREQLLSRAMPPWYADDLGPAVRGGRGLSARRKRPPRMPARPRRYGSFLSGAGYIFTCGFKV